ncbi:cell wall metabolism sensor histidine kinase WalK [Acidaminobacter sp. JC074]|uniref:sensor histidine kinase n=1 Tax=Acidaminobacter sp. JC074 TaxID=2530199 RepID=UPI001F118870|nr:HAMP domain-containing sensor histidine kinase [Acidaminobacter sp. JC074]MCH4887195.1 cell wall metabolism sensor histidine kinase WalK [Acidaminobacter sp. JC074]
MRLGLVGRMTFTTFILFMMFLIIAFFFQGAYFGNFYLDQRIDIITKQVDEFSKDYRTSHWESQELQDNLNLFNTTNGIELTVLDKYGNIKNENVYEIVIESFDGSVHKLQLNHALNSDSESILSLRVGDYIYAEGYHWPSSDIIFKPLIISNGNSEVIRVVDEEANMDFVEGYIIGLNVPTYSDIKSAFYKQPIREVVLDFIVKYGMKYPWLSDSGVYEEVYPNEVLNRLIFYHPLGDAGDREVVFALGSERHIIEAKSILSDYHVYIILLSLVLIVFLSYFYSMTLMRPIIEINDKASKMALLNFDEKIEVTRDDELGSLSESLNTLSTNLSNSMEKLQDANVQLKKEIEKERKLENLRKEFVSGVSHELKTPLGIIRGFAEGVRDDVFEDSTYYLDVIIEETEKMDALVVDMLELSKLESTNFQIEKKHFDLVKLVEFVCGRFEYSLKEKGLEVVIKRHTEHASCFADEFRIEQILVNYLSNAIRHSMRNEKIKIDISETNNRLLLQIENVGEAIPEEKIEKVWNRFYRVEASRNKSDGGTGLGLAIVRNIVELHGTDFGAENTKDGVRFFFTVDIHET